MPAISVLMKPSSGLCNMFCDYCFYCDEMKNREQKSYGFMSEETLRNIIRKTILKAEGSISYAYQGGEPTLSGLEFFEKAIFYQKKYNKNHIRVDNALQTNGYALDEAWCRFLKENHFLVGVSVDGTKEIHDSYRHDKRGNGTYDKVLQGVGLLDQYQVDYNILTVVNRKVAAAVVEIYGRYRERGWKYQQYIPCLEPLGEEKSQKDYALTPEEYGNFLSQLFDLWYRDLQKGQQPYIRQFENYIAMLVGYPPEACDQRGVCGIQYVVEADGGVYPCDFYMLDEYRLGNFNEKQLEFLDEQRRSLGFIERSMKINMECKACPYYGICRGGCQRNRDLDDQTGLYRNYLCEGYRSFFASCYDRMEEVAREFVKTRGK
jgi:uncharacterized protein